MSVPDRTFAEVGAQFEHWASGQIATELPDRVLAHLAGTALCFETITGQPLNPDDPLFVLLRGMARVAYREGRRSAGADH